MKTNSVEALSHKAWEYILMFTEHFFPFDLKRFEPVMINVDQEISTIRQNVIKRT